MDIFANLHIIPDAHSCGQSNVFAEFKVFAHHRSVMNAWFGLWLGVKLPQQTGKGKLGTGNNNLANRRVDLFLHKHSRSLRTIQYFKEQFFTEESNMPFPGLLNTPDSRYLKRAITF